MPWQILGDYDYTRFNDSNVGREALKVIWDRLKK